MAGTVEDVGARSADIRLENLSKRFGDLYAVRDVSLHIRKGDFYTFLGPSGCGKTTLLRMIAGFIAPDAGTISFDGQRVNEVPPWRRDVGMVFQNLALWPHMAVFDNVAFGLRERGEGRETVQQKVRAALELVDLEGLGGRRPSQLSGGQQQRVALARTLVVEPRGLLLDEPLSSLDAKLRIQMRNELVRLQRDLGITTIYVTHDQEEALALSTRVAVFSHGEVVQEGTPKAIYESPCSATVADFVGTSNFLSGRVADVVAERAEVELKGGELVSVLWTASLESAPKLGERLLVSLRPESLRILSDAEQAPGNRICGTVAESIYLGSVLQYEVVAASGDRLRVNVSNPRRTPVLAEGEPVSLSFAPQDAVLLEEGGSGGAQTL